MKSFVHIYFDLERDADGTLPATLRRWTPLIWANGSFEIAAAPVFVHGVAPGDVVLAARRPGDDGHWVQRIVHNSDNWLARVVPRGGRDLEPVVEQFRSLGCEAQATRYGLVTITLPVEVDVSTIMDLLRDGQERAGSWYFDLGVAPPA